MASLVIVTRPSEAYHWPKSHAFQVVACIARILFVNDPTLAYFRALAIKIAGTGSLSSGRTTNEVNHFSLDRKEKLTSFLTMHHVLGGKVRVQMSRASKGIGFQITATLPSLRSISSKPVHGAGTKLFLFQE